MAKEKSDTVLYIALAVGLYLLWKHQAATGTKTGAAASTAATGYFDSQTSAGWQRTFTDTNGTIATAAGATQVMSNADGSIQWQFLDGKQQGFTPAGTPVGVLSPQPT